jgi:hypothetical protein
MGLSALRPVLEPDNGLLKISCDLKERAIFLLDICGALGVSLVSVRR